MRLYEFGSFRIDIEKRLLLREDEPLALTPKAFELLSVLVQNNDRVLEKDELMKALWPDSFVEEGNLSVNMSALRKALGESANEHRYIVTIPGRGYRFTAAVRAVDAAENENADVEKQTTMQAVYAEQEEKTTAQDGLTKAAVAASNVERLNPENGGRKGSSILAAVAFIGVALAAFGFNKLIGQYQLRSRAPLQTMKIIQLTASGKAYRSAISPDGRYVVYAEGSDGGQSLWLTQTSTSSSVQIVPPSDVGYRGLTFSRDGNYIYYVREENIGGEKDRIGALYRMPALGGAPQKLLEGVQSAVALSPDGKQLAYVRRRFVDTNAIESALIVANMDGSGERKLASRKLPDNILPYAPAWSPDGKVIACHTNKPGINDGYVVEVRVADGAEKLITSKEWMFLGAVVWLGDGAGLIMCANDDRFTYTSNKQIWQISYPDGDAQKITNDLNNYDEVSLTADSGSLVAVQSEQHADVWAAPNRDASNAKLIIPKSNDFTWSPDGRIVYSSVAYSSTTNSSQSIWIMDADGSNKKQLTADGRDNSSPSVSPDGRYIVFQSDRSGVPSIWRTDIDGGNPKQLTFKPNDYSPRCSPDGRWVVYMSGKQTIWKSPIDGGDPVQLSDKIINSFDISPDGKSIAYHYREDKGTAVKRKAAIIPFEGGEPIKIFDLPATAASHFIGWMPDGQALSYIYGGNLWSQPLDGGPPQQLTDLKSDRITWCEWSRDGKQLAFVRRVETSDIVLITNFK